MKQFIPFVFLVCVQLPGPTNAGFPGKSLVFPSATANSYVALRPDEFPELSAFTLCLRAASEESRDFALFSYATSASDNELLVWRNEDTRLALYFGTKTFNFALPVLSGLMRHLCISWDSPSGQITFWLDGVRSLRKVGNQGGRVRGGGSVILGQDQDTVGGRFDAKQSFVGEMADVQLWDRVLGPTEIAAVSRGCHRGGGNVIEWETVRHEIGGTVTIQENEDCDI